MRETRVFEKEDGRNGNFLFDSDLLRQLSSEVGDHFQLENYGPLEVFAEIGHWLNPISLEVTLRYNGTQEVGNGISRIDMAELAKDVIREGERFRHLDRTLYEIVNVGTGKYEVDGTDLRLPRHYVWVKNRKPVVKITGTPIDNENPVPQYVYRPIEIELYKGNGKVIHSPDLSVTPRRVEIDVNTEHATKDIGVMHRLYNHMRTYYQESETFREVES
jgi:hypothetical protein